MNEVYIDEYVSMPDMPRKNGKFRIYLSRLARWKFGKLMSGCSHAALMVGDDHAEVSGWVPFVDASLSIENMDRKLKLLGLKKPLIFSKR